MKQEAGMREQRRRRRRCHGQQGRNQEDIFYYLKRFVQTRIITICQNHHGIIFYTFFLLLSWICFHSSTEKNDVKRTIKILIYFFFGYRKERCIQWTRQEGAQINDGDTSQSWRKDISQVFCSLNKFLKNGVLLLFFCNLTKCTFFSGKQCLVCSKKCNISFVFPEKIAQRKHDKLQSVNPDTERRYLYLLGQTSTTFGPPIRGQCPVSCIHRLLSP